MTANVEQLGPCPMCGARDLLTEPAVDDDALPTGGLLIICAGCGHGMGELPGPEPSAEAEPGTEAAEPTEDVDRQAPVEARRRDHRVWP